ncbi:sensor histidine kinase [Haloglomus litoreum]|uniref:sensor histidine kinase n=1 Tax=Haloglomus litoreum TaxID=3034026 RepID=UPI0023E862C8|nr:sensor histidine kinase [Haloglomus sp. DT116]
MIQVPVPAAPLQAAGSVPVPLLAYVGAFLAAALACLAGLARLSVIEDADTRRGMAGLLVTSALWSLSHVVFLVVPVEAVRLGAYYAGLVAGFAAVGAWLYFCSAYTGRGLHRNTTYRRIGVAAFAVVVALKLTNPVHGLYFTTTTATTPFPHLAVEHQLLHWLAMGLSYALAAVGAFMLLELFTLTGYDTRSLVALLGLMGLPLGFDLLGRSSPLLVDMTYEPLGVAAFAVGTLFVFSERFQAVRLAGDIEDPVVILGEGGVIRDTNGAAVDLFPSLEDAVGDRLTERVPELAGELTEGADDIMQLERGGETRYYHVSTNPFTVGNTRLGRMVLVNDVTREERYRRQIEDQNERLGRLAGVISHDLRNPLNVASGRLEMVRNQRDDENLEAVAMSLDRMRRLIENLLTMTREGLDVGDRTPVSLATLAEDAWSTVDTDGAELVVEDDVRLLADPDRLRQVLENLFRNSVEHGSTSSRPPADDSVEHGSAGSRTASDDAAEHGTDTVTVTVGALDVTDGDDVGFFVADDGPGIPPDERERLLEFGESGGDGSGLGLAIVDTIAEAHGWTLTITDAAGGGARFEFTGVEPVEHAATTEPESADTGGAWELAGGGADS